MKIVDAYWEKRNLGIDTKEITIESTDSIAELKKTLNFLKDDIKQYIVVKLPIGKPESIQLLTEFGFIFTESLFEVSLDLKKYTLPKIFEKFDVMLSCCQISSDDDLKRLEKELYKGVFETDRIALNPMFGIEVAAKRYMNWIQDEIKKEAKIFEIRHKNEALGFFAIKPLSANKYSVFLAGMYLNKDNAFFGFSILSKSIEEILKMGGKSIKTHISSNNLSVVRLYAQFGFIPSNICYVMSRISGE